MTNQTYAPETSAPETYAPLETRRKWRTWDKVALWLMTGSVAGFIAAAALAFTVGGASL